MSGRRPSTKRAYLPRRIAALFYDLLLNAALWMITGFIVLACRDGAPVPAGTLWFRCLLFAVSAGFFIGFWKRDGQTAGMKAWRIRIVGRDGDGLTWKAAVVRFLVGCLSIACAGVGFLWALVDADRLTWHDRAAGTRIQLAIPTGPGTDRRPRR
jgi:uncharacterized RDD family membrane protein YckC